MDGVKIPRQSRPVKGVRGNPPWSGDRVSMLRTVVCDDEVPALELLTALLQETGEVAVAASCQDVGQALAVINGGGIDLAVMDIDMPGLSGVEAAAAITVPRKPLLIFATAHPEYAVDAFGVDAIDYLLKPMTPDRVARAVRKAVRLHLLIGASEAGGPDAAAEQDIMGPPDVLRVKDFGHVYFVHYGDVTCIEAAGDYSLVHTADRDYAMRTTIRALEEELPAGQFVRVHRSTIISARHVREIRTLPKGEAEIVLTHGKTVKTSRSYRDAVRRLTERD